MQKSNESELNSLVHHTMSDIHKIYNKYRNIETKTQNTTIVIFLNRGKKKKRDGLESPGSKPRWCAVLMRSSSDSLSLH